MDNLKVVVVGGGMGGLAAAIAVQRAGHDAHVYERAPEIQPIGGGISLWPNAVKALSWLGLGSEIRAAGADLNAICYRDRDGTVLTTISLQRFIDAVGERPYPVTRGDLQDILLDGLGRNRVTLAAECVHVEQDDSGVTATFADGRRARGDLLIGADGIRSAVRRSVFPEAPPPRYAGDIMWLGLTGNDPELNDEGMFTLFVADAKRVGMMPVGSNLLYVFFDAAIPADASLADGDWLTEIQRMFGDWCAPVRALIERLEPGSLAPVPIHDLDPLESIVRGRVALLGDAAHAATPTLGQGAAQAMEDAFVLTKYIVTTNGGVEYALRRYQDARQARTAAVTRESRERTDKMLGRDPKAMHRWYEQLRRADAGADAEFVAIETSLVLDGPLD